MGYRSSVLIGLLAVCVSQQAEASCLRKGKLRGCGKTSVSSSAEYSGAFNDLAYNNPRFPVEVVHYGEPCHRMKALPFSVELPKKRPEAARGFEYGYSVEAMPTHKEGPRGFAFDYQVEVPKPRHQTTLNSYNYHTEVPSHVPEQPSGFAFDYEVQLPKPKSPVKTYEYSYQVNHPAPKHHEIIGQSFDCQLELPQRPKPEKRLEGLVAQVDKVLLPRNYNCPPDVEDNIISSEDYTGGYGYSQNKLTFSDGSYGYGTSEEESANALDTGYRFGEASYESVQSHPYKARYANHKVTRRSCTCYPYDCGYSVMPLHGTNFYIPPAFTHNDAFHPYLEEQSEHEGDDDDDYYYYPSQASPSFLTHPLAGLASSPNSEIYPQFLNLYDHIPYYTQSPRLDKRESVVAHNVLSKSTVNTDDTAYQASNVVDPSMHSFRSQNLNLANPEVANGKSNQMHTFVPNVATRWYGEELQTIPYLYHNEYDIPIVNSNVTQSSSDLQENDLNLNTYSALAMYNNSENATKEKDSNILSEGMEFYNTNNLTPTHEEAKSPTDLSRTMQAFPSTADKEYLTVMNPASTRNNDHMNTGFTNFRDGRVINHTTEHYLQNATKAVNLSSIHQQREAALELSGIPSLNYQQPKKYVILSEDGSMYDFLTSGEADESAGNEENENSIETTISQHYLKSHENGYFIPNIGMGNHWKFSRPLLVKKKKFLPSWLQEPKPDLISDSGFRILKEKVFSSNNGIRRFYEEEPLHRISDLSLEHEYAADDYDEEEYNNSENSDSYFDYDLLAGNEIYENQENRYVDALDSPFNDMMNHYRPARKVLTFPKPSRKFNRKLGKNNMYKKLHSSPRLSERLKKRKHCINLLRQKTGDRFNFVNGPNSISCHDASKYLSDNFGVSIPERVTHPIVGLNNAWCCRGLYPYRGNDVHRLDCSTKTKQDNKDEYFQINCLDRSEDHTSTDTTNHEEHLEQKTEKVEVVVSEHSGLLQNSAIQSQHYPQESAIQQHSDKLSVLETDLAANQAAVEVDIINNGRVGIDLKTTILHSPQTESNVLKHDLRKYEELHDSGTRQELFQFGMNENSAQGTANVETFPHVKKTLEKNCLHGHQAQHNHDLNNPCGCDGNHNTHYSHLHHKYSKVTNALTDLNKNKLHSEIEKPIVHVANNYYPVLAHHSNVNNVGQAMHKLGLASNTVHPYFQHGSLPTKYYVLKRPSQQLHYGYLGKGTAEIGHANKASKEIGPQKDIVEVHLSSHESGKLNSQGSTHFESQNSLTSEAIIDKVGNIVAEYAGNKFSSTPNAHLHSGEHHIIVSETQQESHDSGPVASSFSVDVHHQHTNALPSEEEQQVKANVMKDNNQDDCKNHHTELAIIQSHNIGTDLMMPITDLEVNCEHSSSIPQHEITSVCEDKKLESDALVKDTKAEETLVKVIQHTDADNAEDKFHSITVLKENEPITHVHVVDNAMKDRDISINSKNNRYENAAYDLISHAGHADSSQGDRIEIHIVNKSGEQSEVAAHIAGDGNSETEIKVEQNNKVDEKTTNNEATLIHGKKLVEATHLDHPHISVAQNQVDRVYGKYYPKFEHYGTYPSQHIDHITNKYVGYKKIIPISNNGYHLHHFIPNGIPKHGNLGNRLSQKGHFDLNREQQNIALNRGLVIPFGAPHNSYYHHGHPLTSAYSEHAGKVNLGRINTVNVKHLVTPSISLGNTVDEQERITHVNLEDKNEQNTHIVQNVGNAERHGVSNSKHAFNVLNKMNEGINVGSNKAYYKTHPQFIVLKENSHFPVLSLEQQEKLDKITAASNSATENVHQLSSYLTAGVKNLEVYSKEREETGLKSQGITSVLTESQGNTEYDSGNELELGIIKNKQGEITVTAEVNHPQHSHYTDAAHVHSNVLYEGTQPHTGVDHHFHAHAQHHYPESYKIQHFHITEASKMGTNHNSNQGESVIDNELRSDRIQSKIEEAMDEESIRLKMSQSHIPFNSNYYERYRYVPQQETVSITKQAISSSDLKQHSEQDNIIGFRSAEINPEGRTAQEADATITIPGSLTESFVEHSGIGSIVDSMGTAEITNTTTANTINYDAAFRSSDHFAASPNSDTPLTEIMLIGAGESPQLTMKTETILGANNKKHNAFHEHEGSISVIQSTGGEKQNVVEAVHQRQQHLEIMKHLQKEYDQKYGTQFEHQQVVQTIEPEPFHPHETVYQFPHYEISDSTMFDKNIHGLQEGEKRISIINKLPAIENQQQSQEFQQQHFQEATKGYTNLKDYYSMQELLNKNHQQNVAAATVLNNLQGHQNLHNLQPNLDKVYVLSNEREQLSNTHEPIHMGGVTHIQNLQEKLNKEHEVEQSHHKALIQGTETVHKSQALQNEQKLQEQISSYDNSQQIQLSKVNPYVSQFQESSKLYNVHGQKFFSQKHKEEMKTYKDESKANIMSLGSVTHVKPWHHEVPVNPFIPAAPINIITHNPIDSLRHVYQPHHHHHHHHQLGKHVHIPAHNFRSVETQISRPHTKREIRSV